MNRKAAGALLLALAGLVFWSAAGQAKALTPAPPEARVVFSNGGRILVMNADGSDRQVIFGKGRNPRNDLLGAIEPAVSPDGEKIVFGFRRQARYEKLVDVWVINADGSEARKLLTSTAKVKYGDPDFGPDGRVVAALFRKKARLADARIFTMNADGKARKVIFRLKQRFRPWVGWKSLAEPSISPDGTKLLYLLDPGYDGTFFEDGLGNDLRVLNIARGRSRQLAEDSLGGSWSPDGKRVVFSQVDDRGDNDFCWNSGYDYQCQQFSRLRTIRADGTGERDLTRGLADERSPDWSADGRIVFQSARGTKREIAETTELWSVRPNGKCLTRLTNGSPASLAPVWSDSPRADSRPVACGARPPGPNQEVRPMPASISGVEDLWLGPRFQNLMLTQAEASAGGSQFLYGDCGLLKTSGCGREVMIYNEHVCQYRGYAATFLGSGAVQHQRGIPLVRSLRPGRETPPFTLGFSGRSVFSMIGGSGIGDRRDQHRREIDAMRVVGTGPVAGDLPAARIPAADIRTMKRVNRIYERTGSVKRTANTLGRRGIFVRANLRFAREYDRGHYTPIKCPQRH